MKKVTRHHLARLGATLLATGILLCGGTAQAADADQLLQIQQQWAEIQYDRPAKQRADAFAGLVTQIDAQLQQAPNDPEWLIWKGISLSSQAGAAGGLGALKLAKQARAQFEAAIVLDPAALEGSALTSLGTLYHKVPGWPLGFGNDDKARQLLQQALEVNPDGIDANYFYGEFLLDKGETDTARVVLKKALAAKPRPNRPRADSGRRGDIKGLLNKIG